MSDKDRLIELLEQHCLLRTDSLDCTASEETKCSACLADHLISNGVIVPPCRVGDVVYRIFGAICELRSKDKCDHYCDGFDATCDEYNGVYEIYETPFRLNMIDDIGKTVFLTREDAERALKEREQG